MTDPVTLRLLTDSDHPEGSPSDTPLVERLDALNRSFRWVPWRSVDRPEPGCLYVIRSCWDYHHHPAEFRSFLDRFESGESWLVNRPALVRWNLHKGYLSALAEEGLPVIPHRIVDSAGASVKALRSAFIDQGWDELVLKPCVSAGADGLSRLRVEDLTGSDLRRADREGVMVQPYREEIRQGEWSLIGFAGRFSHAVRKRPGEGDFRVQPAHGGILRRADPGQDLLNLFRQVMDRFDPVPIYGRLDVIRREEGPEIMELELIEPNLYLDRAPASAEPFVRAQTESSGFLNPLS